MVKKDEGYRDYGAGEVNQLNLDADQTQSPNFTSNGKLYLVRCFVCGGDHGRENWAMAVASGKCCWCGWESKASK